MSHWNYIFTYNIIYFHITLYISYVFVPIVSEMLRKRFVFMLLNIIVSNKKIEAAQN